jgi:hypothetical protein
MGIWQTGGWAERRLGRKEIRQKVIRQKDGSADIEFDRKGIT